MTQEKQSSDTNPAQDPEDFGLSEGSDTVADSLAERVIEDIKKHGEG